MLSLCFTKRPLSKIGWRASLYTFFLVLPQILNYIWLLIYTFVTPCFAQSHYQLWLAHLFLLKKSTPPAWSCHWHFSQWGCWVQGNVQCYFSSTNYSMPKSYIFGLVWTKLFHLFGVPPFIAFTKTLNLHSVMEPRFVGAWFIAAFSAYSLATSLGLQLLQALTNAPLSWPSGLGGIPCFGRGATLPHCFYFDGLWDVQSLWNCFTI